MAICTWSMHSLTQPWTQCVWSTHRSVRALFLCMLLTICTSCCALQLNSCFRASTGSVPPRGILSHLLVCPNTRGAEESSEADSDSSGGPPRPHPPPLSDMRPMENNARYWSINVHFAVVNVDALASHWSDTSILLEENTWRIILTFIIQE
jgi:hypothetical protein